jgi:hypothetical protein
MLSSLVFILGTIPAAFSQVIRLGQLVSQEMKAFIFLIFARSWGWASGKGESL